jgi:general secretion pathway protein J
VKTARGSGRFGGFTLVEVLVALTLLSIVAVALFAAVRSGMRVTQAAEARAEQNQEMRVVSELLSRTLTGSCR